MKKMENPMNRRDFLSSLVAGFVLLAGGCVRRTAWPVSGSEKGSVRLVFFTDVHARVEWETPVAMERAANAINAIGADLVIAGGDLITEGFESSASRMAPRWDAYMKMHRGIQADLYPAIGNHDLVAANPIDGTTAARNPRTIYLSKMGLDRTYYSFNAVGYHFVILDSIQVTGDEYQYQGLIWPEEMEWLKQDLKGVPSGTPIVLVTHMPILTAFYFAASGSTSAPMKNRVVTNNRDVLELIENHNVILVLQGHLHVKELVRWKNTAFVVGGAISGKWWRGSWHSTKEGFNIITLSGNQVEWEYIDYGWHARRP